MEESIIKKLMSAVKCSSCGKFYEVDNVEVLGHHESLWFLSVFCPKCRSQYLIAAVVSEEKAIEVISDLTEAELGKFKDAGELTADEMLDMHSFLKDFDGNFSRLFGQR